MKHHIITSVDSGGFIQQWSCKKIVSRDVTAISDSMSALWDGCTETLPSGTVLRMCDGQKVTHEYIMSLWWDSEGPWVHQNVVFLSSQLVGAHARSGHTIPSVSHGSFFQEQMSNPVRRMAWSCLLPFFPTRADCHWQKLFRDWSAWWLIRNPPYGNGAVIK